MHDVQAIAHGQGYQNKLSNKCRISMQLLIKDDHNVSDKSQSSRVQTELVKHAASLLKRPLVTSLLPLRAAVKG